MPTRNQKLVSCGLWRVTVEGSGAKRNKILGQLGGTLLVPKIAENKIIKNVIEKQGESLM